MIRDDIPNGEYHITASQDDRVRLMARAMPRSGQTAFPIFAFVGALGGMGLRIKDLSEMLDLPFHRGPVLARSKLVIEAPLLVDRTYRVETEIECLERKPSRTFGSADHLHLAISLSQDILHSIAKLHIVFPGEKS